MKAKKDVEPETGWLVRILGLLGLAQINLFLTLLAAIVLGAAGVFLTTAWMFGPKIIRDRAEYRRFTAQATGTVVDSWLALELDSSRIRSSEFWRASSKVSPCVVVEVSAETAAADWGAPLRRAFCGTRLKFNSSYTLADVRELAPGVPFPWKKDEHGFAAPEIRVDAATRAWLASHPAHKFMHSDWPASNELAWLMLQLDQPVDQAIAGWSAPPAAMTIQFEPAHPDRALPAGIVRSRLAASPQWFAVILIGGAGLWLWVLGFGLVPQLAGLAPQWRWFVMVLPLLTLPTWVDTFPRFLAPMSGQWTEVITDMLGDLDPLDRLEATAPGGALLANGVRIQWIAAAGAYADTFGRVAPARPATAFHDADAALLALSAGVAERVAALAPSDRAALFDALRRDKRRDLKAAGIVFLGAADRTRRKPADAADARAARAFLEEWFVSPMETPDAHDLAFAARRKLYAPLADVPDPPIAQRAAELAGR
jgi:hypothetical protein